MTGLALPERSGVFAVVTAIACLERASGLLELDHERDALRCADAADALHAFFVSTVVDENETDEVTI